jgi:hypothetical protein
MADFDFESIGYTEQTTLTSRGHAMTVAIAVWAYLSKIPYRLNFQTDSQSD